QAHRGRPVLRGAPAARPGRRPRARRAGLRRLGGTQEDEPGRRPVAGGTGVLPPDRGAAHAGTPDRGAGLPRPWPRGDRYRSPLTGTLPEAPLAERGLGLLLHGVLWHDTAVRLRAPVPTRWHGRGVRSFG